MVKFLHDRDLSAVFHALSDPTRRQILEALREGPKSVGELAAPLDMTFAGASKHIGVLERAELLTRSKEGRRRVCRVQRSRFALVEQWLRDYSSYWNERLDALAAAIEEEEDGGADE